MKKIKIQKNLLSDNLYVLSDKEIALIHAFCVYEPDGMRQEAQKICYKLREQFAMHKAICSFEVWQ
jgi:hypothetical protein